MDSLISFYHEHLATHDPQSQWEELKAGMEAHNLRFRDRYICTVLRPMFMSRADYDRVIHASTLFYGAIGVMHHWLMADEKMRAQMGLSKVEEAAIHLDPGFPAPDGIGRLDGFIDTNRVLRFVEYNADSPGGLAFGHELGDLFANLPTMKAIRKEQFFTPVRALDDLLPMLLRHYHTWGGTKAHPTIGIIDWEGLGTAPEFVLCQTHFEENGYPALISHPAALEIKDGGLWDTLSGKRIDIVYKRVLVGEILERIGLDNILTTCMRDKIACVVNSYRIQMIFKKALFALLSEYADSPVFAPAQRAAIQTHLPWTRLVRDGYTTRNGRTIDLLPFLENRREQFVLKPNGEYGGKGVMLGWESGSEEWRAGLTHAAASESPWVVQERIPLATQEFPTWTENKLVFAPRFMDIDPYTYGPGLVTGAGVRLGATGLLNVTAGGGSAVPLVIVE